MEQVTECKVKNTEIKETVRLFNKLRSSFSREELKKLREKFHKKEEEDSLTKKEEIRRRNLGEDSIEKKSSIII